MTRLPTEVRRKQIAEAALTIIARDGVRRFTAASISREVGLAEGTIFRHFTDKRDIIGAAIHFLDGLMFPADAPAPPPAPLAELRSFLAARVALLRAHPGYLRVLFSNEIGQAAPEGAFDLLGSLRQRSVSTIMSCLRRAQQAGDVRADLPIETLFLVIHGMLLSQVFSGPQLERQLGFCADFDSMWQGIERLMVVAPGAAPTA